MMNNFPVIDYFSKKTGSNIAEFIGSIKSMDLNAKTYQNPRNIYNKINSYVNKLVEFGGTTHGGDIVNVNSTTLKILDLAIPPNASPAQLKAIHDASAEAATKGVNIIIHIID
ncbi:MAG TPA: hypothetical protein DDW78_03355 [Treponema sp.]|nr:hypothetical protein [Treponema sp.]